MRPNLQKSLLFAGLILGAVVATAQALGGPPSLPSSVCSKQPGHRYIAASSAELQVLLKCDLNGATVALKPGDYGKLILYELKGLTLISDNPAKPASFEAIEIEGGNRISLSQIRLGGGTDGIAWRLQVIGSTEIEAGQLELSGEDDASVNGPGGVYVRASDHVSLRQLKISGVANGIRILEAHHIVVSDNIIHDFGSDAVQGSAASQMVISGNYIARVHPAPEDHPDGIQIFTLANQSSASDIAIRDNLIEKGSGGLMQGIFVTDESGRNPFTNLQITDNIVIGSLYHGITVAGANSGAVRNNTVIPLHGQQNWIRLVQADSVVLEGNVAQDLMRENRNLQSRADLGNNRRFVTPETNALAASNAWKAKHFPAEFSSTITP